MSIAVKCPRVLVSSCRYLPRYTSPSSLELSSTASSSHDSQDERYYSRATLGIASLAGFATLYASGYTARAKIADDDEDDDIEDDEEDDDDLDAINEMIEEAATSDTPDSDTAIETQQDKWAAVQEKYLLLSATKRAQIELRDVEDSELARADALYEAGEMSQLEDLLVELNTVSPKNDQVLWRLARLKWVLGKSYATYHLHKVFHVAHSLACQAAEMNPENGDAHRWIAITSSYRAEKDGKAATVRNLEAMKYHLDRAIEINPNDNVALTLLGSWYFECADMTWATRKWCKVFAKVDAPAGSYKKALALFQKSDSAEKWIHNTYWIAKTLLRLGRRDEALEIFKELSKTLIVSVEDYRVKKEAHIFINRLTNPGPLSRLIDSLTPGFLDNWRIPFVVQEHQNTYAEETGFNNLIGKIGPFDRKL